MNQDNKKSKGRLKSLGSFIFGIAALTIGYFSILSLLPGVIGILLGSKALQEMSQPEEDGKALAYAGIIAGSLGMLLSIITAVTAPQ